MDLTGQAYAPSISMFIEQIRRRRLSKNCHVAVKVKVDLPACTVWSDETLVSVETRQHNMISNNSKHPEELVEQRHSNEMYFMRQVCKRFPRTHIISNGRCLSRLAGGGQCVWTEMVPVC